VEAQLVEEDVKDAEDVASERTSTNSVEEQESTEQIDNDENIEATLDDSSGSGQQVSTGTWICFWPD
jgi:hypothetical protein